ncbi:MAG TPA: GNAT family N-acetyltransferase [Halanaerobiales bacterium]|nr:GNAT family N-acetyltransferase [Halanaerobiales bacterium]
MEWKIKHYDEIKKDTLYDILKERVDVFVVEQECPYPEIDGKDKDSYHLWAENNDEIVAYTRLIPRGISYEEASIGRVLVKMDYRGRGLGRKLMEKSLNYIIENLGENEIRISAQERLHDFYVSLGFEQVSEMYLEDGIPHIEMYFNNN